MLQVISRSDIIVTCQDMWRYNLAISFYRLLLLQRHKFITHQGSLLSPVPAAVAGAFNTSYSKLETQETMWMVG